MKTNKKLAIYYRYRNEEIDIRNNLLNLFGLCEDYRKSKYKSVGNYLRYQGYQKMADRLIYEYDKRNYFLPMMSYIQIINYVLYDDLKRLFEQNYSYAMLNKRIKIALYCATHLTR